MSERIKPIEDFIRETTIKYHFSGDGDPLNKVARHIYTAHVKPLEDALAKDEADKAVLVDALECLVIYMRDVEPKDEELDVWKLAVDALARVKGDV